MKLILASSSPRRSDILRQAGLEFEVIRPECDENIPVCEPSQYVMQLSRLKCLAGARFWMQHNSDKCREFYDVSDTKVLVAGADTVVTFQNKILGKPSDEEDAFRMLHMLSGQTHAVFTGVTLTDPFTDRTESFYERTEVTFYPVSDKELQDYISTGEPMDKAGAYGIQGRGVFLVEKINGDYFNVVGLPVSHLIRCLKLF